MQYIFSTVIIAIFIIINIFIVKTDLKEKIIPNQLLLYLLYLLPVWYIYLYFFPIGEISLISFGIQIILSILVSFALFYYELWKAGDAKYLLVLSLFMPHIGIIPFIGNLGLLTLLYLIRYFLWFFIGRSIFYKGYAKNLVKNIKTDLFEKWKIYKKNQGGKTIFLVLKWITAFLIVFVSVRLIKIYLIDYFASQSIASQGIENIIEKYHFYIIFLGGGISFLIFFIFKKFQYLIGKYLIPQEKTIYVRPISLTILLIILISFILYEYSIAPQTTTHYLIKILTLYIILWLFFKIILYGYKLSFGVSEEQYIHIDHLKEGDIVDKRYLHKLFSEQESLRTLIYNPSTVKNDYINNFVYGYTHIIKINPRRYFLELKNPIDNNTRINLQRIYNTVNKNFSIQTKFEEDYLENKYIKIYNTFSFGIYIFIAFVTTIIFDNEIIIFIIKKTTDYFIS